MHVSQHDMGQQPLSHSRPEMRKMTANHYILLDVHATSELCIAWWVYPTSSMLEGVLVVHAAVMHACCMVMLHACCMKWNAMFATGEVLCFKIDLTCLHWARADKAPGADGCEGWGTCATARTPIYGAR